MRAILLSALLVIVGSACGTTAVGAGADQTGTSLPTVTTPLVATTTAVTPSSIDEAPATTTTVQRATATTTTTVLMPPSTPRPPRGGQRPSGTQYEAAKRQWLASGLYIGGAGQNAALPIAINDLKIGESTDTGSKTAYPSAITAIETIGRMPDAMVTAGESAQWHAATAALDRFFDLPAADPYNINCPLATNTKAARAWNEEPIGTGSGVLVQPLEQAAADLEPQASTNPCYRAAIDDLDALRSATRPMIAETATVSLSSYSPTLALAAEIGYVNQVFESDGVDPAQDRLVPLSR